MADFNFLLPAGALPVDGGGAYVRSLAAALTAAGHGVWFGDGPNEAIRIVDGLALTAVASEGLRGAIGLIHHPDALGAERERLPLLRRIIATSAAVRERLVADFGLDGASIDIVRPGVPDALRSSGSGGAECTLLTIGALVPRKGHATMLTALARLFDLPWRLVLVGDSSRDPAYTASLHDQLAKAGCAGQVRFAGVLDDAALEVEWRNADIFALATEWEGYSAPIAEALRRGLPVAATSGGQAAELVTPEVGIVCTPGDVVTLSKSLRRLIFDTYLRADMAEAAWQLGQTLPDWKTQAVKFVEAATCS